MVSTQHEATHRIFRDRPQTLRSVLGRLGIAIPDGTTYTKLETDATEVGALVRHIDSVVEIDRPGLPPMLLAIESQTERETSKPRTWMYYLSHLAEVHTKEVMLLVVTQNPSTARWAEGPFTLGDAQYPSLTLRPLVAGPDRILPVLDPAQAIDDLDAAAAAAVINGKSADVSGIMEVFAHALNTVGADRADLYAELFECALADSAARKTWRRLMAIQLQDPDGDTFIAETLRQGRAEGRGLMVLEALENRGIDVPEHVRERVLACTDPGTFHHWLSRSFQADKAEDIFADDTPVPAPRSADTQEQQPTTP